MQTLGSTGSKHARASARAAAACPPQDPSFVRPVRFAVYRTAKSRVLHKNPLLLLAPVLALLSLAFTTPIAQAAEEREPKVFLGTLSEAEVPNPKALAFDHVNGRLIVATGSSSEPGEVKLFPTNGGASVGELTAPQGAFAFDSQFAAGLAVDTTGDVYVSDTARDLVDKFGPAGEYLCEFSGVSRGCVPDPEVELGTPNTFGEVIGLAVDSAGDLYVADNTHDEIDEFNAAGDDLAQIKTSVGHPEITAPPDSLALDAAGDLFVEIETAPHRVVEFQHPLSAEESLISAGVSGITYDQESGLLLLAERFRVSEYDPLTRALVPPGFATDVGGGHGGIAAQEDLGGIAGDTFILNPSNPLDRVVEIYGPAPLVQPAVHGEEAAGVSSDSAQLKAVVEPELRSTHYQFQYGPDESYSLGALPASPGGLVAGGTTSAAATATLEGLTSGATYHYRLVATNKAGTAFGPDRTFTTLASPEASLPDGRVWEMVSPLNKNGGDIFGPGAQDSIFQASANGEKVAYLSLASFGGPQGNILANQYVASRTPAGWSSQNITPATVAGGYFPGGGIVDPYAAFSPDLSHALFRDGVSTDGSRKNPPIPGTGAPAFYDNFYLRDNLDDSFQAILSGTPPSVAETRGYEMFVEGVSPDLSHVVVATEYFGARLELDEWSGSALVPVDILPDGQTAADAVPGSSRKGAVANGAEETHTVSSDGRRVFWSEGGEPVYVREDAATTRASTLKLPPGEFLDASATGSRALLSTGELYDVEHQQPIADLTSGHGGFEGELGASEDLSSIYFVDSAVLSGNFANSAGQEAKAGQNNLYLYRDGAPTVFVATLAEGAELGSSPDSADWSSAVSQHTARVTPDGGSALFQSDAQLTGFDDHDAATGALDSQIFLYHAASHALVCVSCNPTGQRPTGPAVIPAGAVPQKNGVRLAFYAPRVLSNDGERVFFDSHEALVAADTDDVSDAYEWENGHATLISSGTGSGGTFFDASESGDNVFFLTGDQLVAGDSDQLTDLYDARVDGGFPTSPTEPGCTGGGCQGVPAPAPIFATPAGATFAGIGNFPAPLTAPAKPKTTKCKKHFVKKKGKCVRQKPKRKAKKSSRSRRTHS